MRLTGVPHRELLAPSRVAFRVMPNDCDINFHMNNGRYLTFMDLGRVHLMRQVRLIKTIIAEKWMPVLAAAEITFIRSLVPFQRFELVTQLMGWDEKYVYIEQKFESHGKLYAHAFVKAVFLKAGQVVPNAEVVAKAGYSGPVPPMPEELRLWAQLGTAKRERAAN